MKINMKTYVILLAACSVVSGTMISVEFVQDFMKLYTLKDPMFILHESELDEFLWEFKPLFFEAIYCLCYEMGTNHRKYSFQIPHTPLILVFRSRHDRGRGQC